MKNTSGMNKRKFFHKSDLILYAVLLMLVFCLFLFFVIIPHVKNGFGGTDTTGFTVYKENSEILSYDYSTKKIDIRNSNYSSLIDIENNSDNINIIIYTDNTKKDYNKIFIDTKTNSAKIIESTCFNKFCVNMGEINKSGVIYCAPHKLKIIPKTESGFIPPVAG